jgi:hypothetical protein
MEDSWAASAFSIWSSRSTSSGAAFHWRTTAKARAAKSQETLVGSIIRSFQLLIRVLRDCYSKEPLDMSATYVDHAVSVGAQR